MTRFKPGLSGNPTGRKKGAIGLITKKRAVLEAHLPAIVQATKDLVQFGDTETLTNCLRTAIEAKAHAQ
jgi:hypothetical protein